MNDDIVHHLLYDYYLMNNRVYPLVLLLLMMINEVNFHSVMLKYLLLVLEILFHLSDNDINLLEVMKTKKKKRRILLLMNDVRREYFLQLNHWYH